MATIVAQVCDVCSDLGVPVQEWTIKSPDGDERAIDLCSKHEEPIRKLMGSHSESGGKGGGAKGEAPVRSKASSKRRVLSMEEVDELRSR